MKAETIGDVVTRALKLVGCEVCGAAIDASKVVEREFNAGLLKARIVRGVCPTCGGSGSVTGAEDFPGGDEGYDVTCSPCPDCADAPTWVIALEAWEAFVTELDELGAAVSDASVDTILQALLPGARVLTGADCDAAVDAIQEENYALTEWQAKRYLAAALKAMRIEVKEAD